MFTDSQIAAQAAARKRNSDNAVTFPGRTYPESDTKPVTIAVVGRDSGANPCHLYVSDTVTVYTVTEWRKRYGRKGDK